MKESIRPGLAQKLTSSIVAASFLLTACEVEFTPDVVPLKLGTAPPEAFAENLEGPDEQLEALVEQPPPGEAQFNSSDAMELCGSQLGWGDGTKGMCLAPDGDSYYVWTGPTEVMTVPVDANDPNQLGFLQAVIARSGDMGGMVEGARSAGWSVAGLFITVVGFPFACVFATLVGCIIDGAAVVVTAGLVAEAGSSFNEDLDSFEPQSSQADYFFCRMQGSPDQACRDAVGITPEQLGGSDG